MSVRSRPSMAANLGGSRPCSAPGQVTTRAGIHLKARAGYDRRRVDGIGWMMTVFGDNRAPDSGMSYQERPATIASVSIVPIGCWRAAPFSRPSARRSLPRCASRSRVARGQAVEMMSEVRRRLGPDRPWQRTRPAGARHGRTGGKRNCHQKTLVGTPSSTILCRAGQARVAIAARGLQADRDRRLKYHVIKPVRGGRSRRRRMAAGSRSRRNASGVVGGVRSTARARPGRWLRSTVGMPEIVGVTSTSSLVMEQDAPDKLLAMMGAPRRCRESTWRPIPPAIEDASCAPFSA